MNQTDRPLLTLEIECKLEGELNQIHALYWPRLQKMQEFTREATEIYRSIAPGKLPIIPSQRSPNALKLLLGQYAIALFKEEAAYYPNESELLRWLDKLGERVTSMVLNKVAQVEHAGSFRHVSLSYHNVPLAEMRDAISIALLPMLRDRFVDGGGEQIKQTLVTDQTIGAKPRTGKKEIAKTRKAFIDPLLMEKGWSILDWAHEADVAYHTAADYLAGTTKPFRSSRAKLAKALGISPNALP